MPKAHSGPLTALWSMNWSARWELRLGLFALDFQYIDAELPPESPYLYGLHPNAEIGFLTQTSEKLFRTVLGLQPRDSRAGDGAGATREDKVCGRVAQGHTEGSRSADGETLFPLVPSSVYSTFLWHEPCPSTSHVSTQALRVHPRKSLPGRLVLCFASSP